MLQRWWDSSFLIFFNKLSADSCMEMRHKPTWLLWMIFFHRGEVVNPLSSWSEGFEFKPQQGNSKMTLKKKNWLTLPVHKNCYLASLIRIVCVFLHCFSRLADKNDRISTRRTGCSNGWSSVREIHQVYRGIVIIQNLMCMDLTSSCSPVGENERQYGSTA